MQNKKKVPSLRIRTIFIVVGIALTVCLLIYVTLNYIFSPYWGSVYPPDGYLSFNSISFAESDDIVYSKEQAVEDMQYILDKLERVHPLYIDGLSDEIKAKAQDEINSWGEQVDTYELWRSVARVLSLIGDAHTMMNTSFSRNYLCDYLQKSENGYQLQKINGLTIDELFDSNKDLFSYELESWGRICTLNSIQSLEGLKFLGIDTQNDIYFEYISPDGVAIKRKYSCNDFKSMDEAKELLEETEDEPIYEYSVDSGNDIGLFTLRSCQYDSGYKEILYNFFSEVISSNINNVVLDLRENLGGNSGVADEFILYLSHNSFKSMSCDWRLGPYMLKSEGRESNIDHYDDMLFSGKVYVLTSERTFSSGVLFAEILADNAFAEIVGETPGNMPASYGDIAVFQTPNAKLSFQISTKKFDRINADKSNAPLIPDYECDADYAYNAICEMLSK